MKVVFTPEEKKQIQAIIKDYQDQLVIGLCILDEEANCLFQWNAQQCFPAASLIKLGIARFIAMNYPTSLPQTIFITPESFSSGAGIIPLLTSHHGWTVKELVALMLAISDNTAANALIKTYDQTAINDWLQVNYPRIQLKRYFMEENPIDDNLISADIAAKLMYDLFTTKLDHADILTVIHHSLENQQFREGIPAVYNENQLPELKLYNKNGTLPTIYHDVCHIRYYDRSLTLAGLTKMQTPNSTDCLLGQQFLQKIGAFIIQLVVNTPKT